MEHHLEIIQKGCKGHANDELNISVNMNNLCALDLFTYLGIRVWFVLNLLTNTF